MSTALTDTECLEQIIKGGTARQRGVAELYHRYARKFAGYFSRHNVPREHVEDVVQDTFVKIVRSCESFRGESELGAWLWRIAKNCMVDYFRKQRPADAYEEDIHGGEASLAHSPARPGKTVDSLEDCVQWALERFAKVDAERTEILRLAAIEGWSTAEVAHFIGRTLGATREYISQCRKHFQKYLEPCRDYLAE